MAAYQYRVLEARSAKDLEEQLNAAARGGWEWLSTVVLVGVQPLLVATLRADAAPGAPESRR